MNDTLGAITLFAAVMLIILFGVWAGTSSYKHDTFDCTRACDGAHSIWYNQKCYCGEEP